MNPLFLSLMLSAQPKDIPMQVLDKCIERELEACGDKLCEMSTDDNYLIAKQAFENLKDCIEKEMK